MTDVLITAVAFAGLLAAVLILAALAILAVSGYVDWLCARHSTIRMALLIEALRTEPAEIEADADDEWAAGAMDEIRALPTVEPIRWTW